MLSTVCLLLTCVAVAFGSHATHHEDAKIEPPMVAFLCNKPAMYLTKHGWVQDDTTGCLKKPKDILDYCKKIYKNMDVTNYVEFGREVHIKNWCRQGQTDCDGHNSHRVRPLRCLVGAFQSDALLVPEHCQFDHLHDQNTCISFSKWNSTAHRSCLNRGMRIKSAGSLLPCGVHQFSGIEFVCCPADERRDDDENAVHRAGKPEVVHKKPKAARKPELHNNIVAKKAPYDPYVEYLHHDQHFGNEHEAFVKAKSQLDKNHHEKVTRMMKEWSAARQRVQEMKNADPKGADKLNKEITARFQKTYQALEMEEQSEKKQLVGLHQQRVQAALNEKKRHAMEHFMTAVERRDPDSTQILKALKHYIKTEQKDRMHSVNRFKHVLDADPEEAERIRQHMFDHLRIINQRIKQALEMLNRVPKFQKKIRQAVDAFLKNFHSIDVSIDKLMAREQPAPTPVEKKTPKPEAAEKKPMLHEVPLHHVQLDKKVLKPTKYDDEDWEDEEVVVRHKPVQAHHQLKSTYLGHHDGAKVVSLRSLQDGGINSMIIAVSSIAVFVLIVAGIVLVRRRSSRPSRNVLEVEPEATPEQRHVKKMQMNGFENPTYKFLENSAPA